MNRKRTSLQLICLLLVSLWVYTAVSKLQEPEVFQAQLHLQPFPERVADLLVWLLPLVELVAAVLLFSKRNWAAGLGLSFVLMLLFTGYVALVLAGAWGYVPCACGGVISSLDWKQHLLFNLFFTALAGTGILLMKQKRRGDSERAAASGDAAY